MARKRQANDSDDGEGANALTAALPKGKKAKLVESENTQKPGVVYLGRIPRGFYEDQMKAYFSQFGDVTRLRLSRNRKTGASRHYAFIEFASSEVAAIVAETMNNYLLLGHLLQCHVLEEAQVHPRMWMGANKRMRTMPAGRIAREQINRDKSPKARAKIGRRLKRSDAAKRERLAKEGIEYEFIGHAPKQ